MGFSTKRFPTGGREGRDARRLWARLRGVTTACLCGAMVGSAAMLGIGFRIGNRVKPRGNWWQRITGPATVVVPVPAPLGTPGCRPGDRPPALPSDGWLREPPLTWDDFRGRIVVVDVWATWCPYCEVMASDLTAICQRFEAQGVVMLSITPDDRQTAAAFYAQHRLSGPVVCDAEGFLRSWLADRYPALIAVGRDGTIVWNDGAARMSHRIDELAKTLSEVLEDVSK